MLLQSPGKLWSAARVLVSQKLGRNYEEYSELPYDEEGRVALTSAVDGNGDVELPSYSDQVHIALEDNEPGAKELPKEMRQKVARRRCCGTDCSTLWKLFGIVLALFILYSAAKAAFWVIDGPSSDSAILANLPEFSTSLGCSDAPFIYSGSAQTFTAPLGTHGLDHLLAVRGHAVSVITLADGERDATEVKYQFVLRANDQRLLTTAMIDKPEVHEDGTVTKSRLTIYTPAQLLADRPDACSRLEMTVYIPPNLKKFSLSSYVESHVQFAKDTKINADKLFVTLFHSSKNNIIKSSQSVQAKKLALEVYEGWIVGEATVVDTLDIMTQRGSGIANVKVSAAAANHGHAEGEKVQFTTASGSGRSDIWYTQRGLVKRPVNARHLSSKNAELYLHYEGSDFNGKVELDSRSNVVTGLSPYVKGAQEDSGWTHTAGRSDGQDRMVVGSRGWVGLYFQ